MCMCGCALKKKDTNYPITQQFHLLVYISKRNVFICLPKDTCSRTFIVILFIIDKIENILSVHQQENG